MNNIKRLRFRNLDKKWTTLPQGADNDEKIRSYNFFDGQRWLNPRPWSLPDWIWYLPGDGPHSLNLYDGDLEWQVGNGWNPNPAPPSTSWVRLTAMGPRNNENWKILHWDNYMPNPEQTPAYPYVFGGMPDGSGRGSILTAPNLIGYAYAAEPGADPRPWDSVNDYRVAFNYIWAIHPLTAAAVDIGSISGDPLDVRHGYDTALIDLENYRTFQETYWPRSKYFVGQYKPMQDMQLKRIVIRGFLQFRGAVHPYRNWDGAYEVMIPEPAELWPAFQCSLMYLRSAPAVANPITNPSASEIVKAFPPRRPMAPQTTGPIIHFQQLMELDENGEDTIYTQTYGNGHFERVAYREWSAVIEEPGEDNIKIGFELEAPPTNQTHIPGTSDHPENMYPGATRASARAAFTKLEFHYATPGHDTPAEEHLP